MTLRSDQAAGLRRLFGERQLALWPVVAPAALPGSDALLDALIGALLERGLRLLVVDASARAQAPHERARIDLAAGIEQLGADVRWLEARGLVARHLDTHGRAGALREALCEVASGSDVLLVHAPVADLARLLPGAQCLRPLLLTDLQAEGLTAAYGAMKWLHERAGCGAFSALLAAPPGLTQTRRVAQRLADTGERFLGVALADWAAVDVRAGPTRAAGTALRRLVRDALEPEGLGGRTHNALHRQHPGRAALF